LAKKNFIKKTKLGNYHFFLLNLKKLPLELKNNNEKVKKSPIFHIFLKIAFKKIGINKNLRYKNEKALKMVIFDKIL
jgi:hypothetical protein